MSEVKDSIVDEVETGVVGEDEIEAEGPKDDLQETVDDYDAEKVLAEAQAAVRRRLEEIGGKFDSEGNFLGFDNEPISTSPSLSNLKDDATIEEILDHRLAQFEQRVMGAFQPTVASSVLERVVESHPELAPYKKIAAELLKKTPPSQISDEFALSVLYFVRGQSADIEVANARKEERERLRKEREQLIAGAVAGSDGGVTTVKPTTKVKVTPLIQRFASAWGLDPEELAAELASKKEVNK